MDGRSGFTNRQLVEMWPAVPDSRCPCGVRGVCVWVDGLLLCGLCVAQPKETR